MSFCWSADVGCCNARASSFVAKQMSGLVYVIHCSLPTARRNALCSSSLSGWSRSAVGVFSAAVPGAVAAFHLSILDSSRSVLL